ncbi:MAG: hypothetical protein ACT4QF_20415 [Sporichthyaceae bacterium]
MQALGCREPAVRAATLIHTPGSLSIATVDTEHTSPTVLACLWGRLVLTLLPPGPVADAIRSGTPLGTAAAAANSATANGTTREHGWLNLYGTLRPVPAACRRTAALRLYDVAPREELLDGCADEGWLLSVLDLRAADWTLPTATSPLDPNELRSAAIDEVLRWSPQVCAQLNSDHPDLAEQLHGGPAWFAEVDRDGATLGHPADGGFSRIAWPAPCHDLHDLHHTLAHSPVLRRRACRRRRLAAVNQEGLRQT